MFDAHKLGYIRAGAAIPELYLGDPEANGKEIVSLAHKAAGLGIRVLVYPELCLTGYTCGDLFLQRHLLDAAAITLEDILAQTRDLDTVLIMGIPLEGDTQLYNCAVILHRGEILGAVPKLHLPNHNEFYEKRWFSGGANRLSDTVKIGERQVPFGQDLLFKSRNLPLVLGAELCQDLWMTIPPSSYQALNGANLIVNPSASNELAGKAAYRSELVNQQSARCIAGYIYASSSFGESTTDAVFAGHALISENGIMLAESRFEEDVLIYRDLDLQRLDSERKKISGFRDGAPAYPCRIIEFAFGEPVFPVKPGGLARNIPDNPFVPDLKPDRNERCREIFKIQIHGLAGRLKKTKIPRALVAISGGLDSTLALLVTKEAFTYLNRPLADILCITMPGFGTTDRTKSNAHKLMEELGVEIREIPIVQASLVHFKDIGHDPDIHDITYENTQARERTQIMLDIANKEKGILVGTGDLSELALGWCTYNGDHMSHYGVNAGVPKTLVKYLVRWYADTAENHKVREVLLDILDTPISPELLPPGKDGNIQQKTENLIGSYDLHDFFLYHGIRWSAPPQKVYFLACGAFKDRFSKQEILDCLKLFYKRFFHQQFKRSCMPDGPKVGSISLSPRGDWRMPSDALVNSWSKQLNELETAE